MSADTCTFAYSPCCATTPADFDAKYPTQQDMISACQGGPDQTGGWAQAFRDGTTQRPSAETWIDFTQTSAAVTAELGSQVRRGRPAGYACLRQRARYATATVCPGYSLATPPELAC